MMTMTMMTEKDSIEILDLCKIIPKHRNNQNLLFYFHNTCVMKEGERDVPVIELSYCNNKPSTHSMIISRPQTYIYK